MKLRQAIKICNELYGDYGYPRSLRSINWKPPTVQMAIKLCNRRSGDRRIPYIPSDDEMQERGEMLVSIFEQLLTGEGPLMELADGND